MARFPLPANVHGQSLPIITHPSVICATRNSADKTIMPSSHADPISCSDPVLLWSPFIAAMRDYAMLLLDPAGNILSWNRGAELIKGYRADEVLGRHFSCLYPPEDAAAH